MQQLIEKKIIKRVGGHGEGWAFTPKDFIDFGSRSVIDVSLHRLRKKSMIRQIMRGVYDRPGYSKLFKSPTSPEPDQIARAIARNYGWTIVPSGETALNLIGISRQVPSKYIYFSDGPYKKYSLGNRDLVFKRRAIKETGSLSWKTALVVQALKALGEGNIDAEVNKRLSAYLKPDERTRAKREAKYATSWVYEIIKKISGKEKSRG
jgi:hypothetical protein